MEKILKRIRPYYWAFLILGILVLIEGGIQVSNFVTSRNKPSVPVGIEKIQSEIVNRRLIDGVVVPTGTKEVFPMAVIIENSIDARPLSGITKANLVWEAPAEAGITRLLAVFADGTDVSKIGPVRSARPYYVDWSQEFGALLAHVGGSPEALELISKRPIIDLNQFWNDRNFWRSTDRLAPHNVYTSTKLLNTALAKRGITEIPKYGSWIYKDDAIIEARPQNYSFRVDFSSKSYLVTWMYNRDTNDYGRLQTQADYYPENVNHDPVRAKNVVVMKTKIVITDEVGRRRISTIGEGDAVVIRDGQKIEATWRRDKLSERTRFFDSENKEIPFNAGTTWIEVISSWNQFRAD